MNKEAKKKIQLTEYGKKVATQLKKRREELTTVDENGNTIVLEEAWYSRFLSKKSNQGFRFIALKDRVNLRGLFMCINKY